MCGLPMWLHSSIFAPTATFCFRFAPAANLCFRTRHSAQKASDEEQRLPEYGTATLCFPTVPDYRSRHNALFWISAVWKCTVYAALRLRKYEWGPHTRHFIQASSWFESPPRPPGSGRYPVTILTLWLHAGRDPGVEDPAFNFA
jgi:hypothetical protein